MAHFTNAQDAAANGQIGDTVNFVSLFENPDNQTFTIVHANVRNSYSNGDERRIVLHSERRTHIADTSRGIWSNMGLIGQHDPIRCIGE